MAQVLQLRRGTTAQNDAFTGAVAEVSVDTDRDSLRVHDGTTMGGKEIAPLNVAIPLLADATTVNAADELIVRQGGVVKRATGAELAKGLNAVNGIVSVKDLGAAGDGTTDDTAAFTAALFASAAIVLIPAGNYYIPNPSAIAASTPKLWMAANAYFRTTVGGTLLPFSGILRRNHAA
jgi:polygalacturonase